MFLDIGGVLLSNGWDKKIREKTFKHFKLDLEEVEKRHHLVFDTFERGKMTLQEYLQQVVLYTPQQFTANQFVDFIYQHTIPNQESIDFFLNIKSKYQLQVVAISNEGREFTVYRVKQFGLKKLFDAFVSSAFVRLRKRDKDILNKPTSFPNYTSGTTGPKNSEKLITTDGRKWATNQTR